MNTRPQVQLHLFLAAENDRAVILRQGPSKTYRMILWHRDTDRFEDGQWVKNKVYVDRCDLSPDGRHFLFFMLDGDWRSDAGGSYSAASRPPYWTALALMPKGDTWGGGGVFIDNRHYIADGGADIIGRDEGLSRVFLKDPSKDCRTGLRLVSGRRAPLSRAASRRLLADPEPATPQELHPRLQVPREDWRDLYAVDNGQLFRRKGTELQLIRDFTDMDFEPIRAPYDWRDDAPVPKRSAWHPLDGEG